MRSNKSIWMRASLALPLIFFALLAPRVSWSQQVNAAITGKVTDSTGAAIADAQVTATDLDRGTILSTITNSAGVYDLPQVPVGNYSVRVEKQGFQTAQQSKINLVLNQVARLDFR